VDDADVVALEVLPESITVVLDSILRKPVPVLSRVELRPDSGYEVFGDVRISPGRVTVQGPAALVSAIQNVPTNVLRRTGLTAPAEYTVQIDTSGYGLVTVIPQSVRVTADIGPVSTAVLMGVAVNIEEPWESTPYAVSVTVRGPASRVRLFTRDSVTVVARPSGTRDEEIVPVEVVPPTGVSGIATPDSVRIRRSSGG
jgi:hypothetical protein